MHIAWVLTSKLFIYIEANLISMDQIKRGSRDDIEATAPAMQSLPE